ncbi:unnamed protein product [Brassicogethes aeneus]|uniref:Uncharacterized protein n=1 Tax=Brassicogethes aeneus TaxID=1431903 RepID=A0A9P0FFA9_BRAAE|nr:unnamed protein product [Brassicogethes aeneus]
MSLELFMLFLFIIIFFLSFCGLLKKIRQTYEEESQIIVNFYAARSRRDQRSTISSMVDWHNPSFLGENGIYPNAPPPYSQLDLPPKYEDIIRDMRANTINTSNTLVPTHTTTPYPNNTTPSSQNSAITESNISTIA